MWCSYLISKEEETKVYSMYFSSDLSAYELRHEMQLLGESSVAKEKLTDMHKGEACLRFA